MFECAGSKLKTVAKTVFWIGVAAYGIIGMIILVASIKSDEFGGVILAPIVTGVGILVSYLSILLLLALGELVESSTLTAYYSRQILEELRPKKKAQLQSHVPSAVPSKNLNQTENANTWFCGACGTENSRRNGACVKCGKRIDC